MNKIKTFMLFAPCIPVKGHTRSIIYDIYRRRFKYIPNTLYYLLTEFKGLSIEEVKKEFPKENNCIIDGYFDYLKENEFGVLMEKSLIKYFPEINLEFNSPFKINHALVDVDLDSNHDFIKIFEQLTEINCMNLQLRFFGEFKIEAVARILSYRINAFQSIHIILKYYPSNNFVKLIKRLIDSNPISKVDVYSVPSNIVDKLKITFKKHPVSLSAKNVINSDCCGIIKLDDFFLNVESFAESKRYNSCLNGKISIDINGEIKNCPSMNKTYGKYDEITLSEVAENKQYSECWNISKDQIKVCQDCEYRYMCTDCRAYLEDPYDLYSKPLKCGYNPYTGIWENWSTNPLKKDIIDFYKLKESSK
jgi:SPASM domain peptide maturase of grasp-with-spasm system